MLWETLANIPSWKDLDQLERIASGRGNITALNVGHTRNPNDVLEEACMPPRLRIRQENKLWLLEIWATGPWKDHGQWLPYGSYRSRKEAELAKHNKLYV